MNKRAFLVIENRLLYVAVEILCKKAGISCFSSEDGEQLTSLYKECGPDLLIVDDEAQHSKIILDYLKKEENIKGEILYLSFLNEDIGSTIHKLKKPIAPADFYHKICTILQIPEIQKEG